MVPQEREMRYTIMTPTLQRPELLRACESVNNQTCKDWEHLVIFDGEFKDKELLAKIVHPQRKVMKCLVPEGHSHSYGHPCKHYAWPEAQGDYLFNLDDDNYLLHDGVFEDLKQVTGVWAIFPMLYFGKRFLNDPPGLGLTASENFLVKREMGQWPDRLEYAADGYLVEQLKSKYPYQSFPSMRPTASLESSNYPGFAWSPGMVDLTVTVLQGRQFTWDQLEPYAVSLCRSGFKGTKMVFVNDIDPTVRANFLRLGFTLSDYERENSSRIFFTTRHEPWLTFLEKRYKDFRYVIWTDATDVVFQSDPSKWLEVHAGGKIVGVTESLRFKDEPLNDEQVKHALDDNTYRQLREHEVCNCGTVAGNAKSMLDLFSGVRELLKKTPEGTIDQAVYNSVFRSRTDAMVPSLAEGFAAVVSWFLMQRSSDLWRSPELFTNPTPRLDDSGLVYPSGKDVPFSIVHLYDWDQRWKAVIGNRYKEVLAPTTSPRALRRPPRWRPS